MMVTSAPRAAIPPQSSKPRRHRIAGNLIIKSRAYGFGAAGFSGGGVVPPPPVPLVSPSLATPAKNWSQGKLEFASARQRDCMVEVLADEGTLRKKFQALPLALLVPLSPPVSSPSPPPESPHFLG